jgi:raffinose/stachyose/melibiose transport system substrate-binding protein
MKKTLIIALLVVLAAVPLANVAAQDPEVELVMGSWRTEDIEQWDKIIAAFNEEHPNITVSLTNTQYRVRCLYISCSRLRNRS